MAIKNYSIRMGIYNKKDVVIKATNTIHHLSKTKAKI